MAINIKNIARKATLLSELMESRDKIETRDIIKYYPKGIHINDCEKVFFQKENDTEEFYVYTFDEDDKKFAFSGYILSKIFDGILEQCDGDFNMMRKELSRQKLEVKLSEGRTKDTKQPITNVEVI